MPKISELPASQGVGPAAFYRRQAPTVITGNHTLVAADNGKVIICELETAQFITLPAGLPAGFQCQLVQGGAAVTADRLVIQPDTGVTLRAQHRVSPAVWGGGPGAILTVTRLADAVYSVGGDMYLTLDGAGQLVAEIDGKLEIGQATPLVRSDWLFADIAERDAETVAAGDVGYIARVASPLGFFRLVSVGPAVWEQIGGGTTQGKHAIYIAAGSMRESVAGGCAPLSAIASAANQPDIVTLNFDATTQEFAQFSLVMPKKWNEGTVTFVPHWSHAATTVNFGVVWGLQGVAVSNDDAIAVAFGTEQTSTDTGGTTNDLYSGPESAAITIAGTPAAEDMVFFRVNRNPAAGSDTMAVDARLHGITLFITTNADTDA